MRTTSLICAVLFGFALIGCNGDRHLTKADAQKGVDKALVEMTARFNLEPSRSAMVIGIVENQQENTAVADVTFSHFVFPCAGYSNLKMDLRQGTFPALYRWSLDFDSDRW